VALDLRFDMAKQEISGSATIELAALRAGLDTVALDAVRLEVQDVESVTDGRPLKFDVGRRDVQVHLAKGLEPGSRIKLRIAYSCRPRVGMYFFSKNTGRGPEAWNYGEGGLHYGWLPLYNDTNDRFTLSADVTVARPFVALSNGVLQETRENPDGTRTFRWRQDEPIPNYLVTVDVGELASVPLPAARLGNRKVPLTAWVPPGEEAAATHTFGDTTRMVEFFSERFGYDYPWAKYDQVALREFAAGAMETTSLTGFSESHLHRPDDPPDGAPSVDKAYPTWTAEDTIAHELAHHWFGDLVTCRSLGSIWLNESFATFAHTAWNGFAHGEDDLTYQRWRYLNTYLDYVHASGQVRPMEYPRYESFGDAYQEETTYIKGSLVLHLLRHVVGEGDFYRALSLYLRRNAFRNVDSADLEEALGDATGLNLSWFFRDWIVGGGGHPAFRVSRRWSPERKQVDLTVEQVQADQPFENAFHVPVDVEVVTASGSRVHRIVVDGWKTRVAIPSDEKPLAVVFDKGGWVVSEVQFERGLREVLYLLEKGGLAERLRAARQLATDFPQGPEAVEALSRVVADPGAHWGLRQEAAEDLARVGGEGTAAALITALHDADRRVRRAAAVALGGRAGRETAEALRRVVETDAAEDVVAAASFSLGRIHAPGAREVLEKQLQRDSRWWDVIRVGALKGLAELEDPSLAATFAARTTAEDKLEVRLAALDGWLRAAPEDPRLWARLRELTADGNRKVRSDALKKLTGLHRAADLPFLRELAEGEDDPDLARAARDAAEEGGAFSTDAVSGR
jgi:aminopeptidase N